MIPTPLNVICPKCGKPFDRVDDHPRFGRDTRLCLCSACGSFETDRNGKPLNPDAIRWTTPAHPKELRS